MAFPTSSTVLDDFNRANETPLSGGPGWTSGISGGFSGPNLVGNQVVGNGSLAQAYITSPDFGPDVEARYTFVTATGQLNLYARLTPGASVSGYMLQADAGSNQTTLYRIDNGAQTSLGVDTTAISDGELFGISCVGNQITAWFNFGSGWSSGSIGTVTDSTYSAAGKIGIAFFGSGVIDDLIGGSVAAAVVGAFQ